MQPRKSLDLIPVHMSTALAVLAITAFALVSARPSAAQEAASSASTAQTPAQCGIPGHHALLERMSAAFELTCDQQRKIEPLLHDEESVSKPLIAFEAFTPRQKKAVMQQVKLAAREQIMPLLTPPQKVKMQQEIDTVSRGGEGLQKGSGHRGKKNAETAFIDPFQAQENLCDAISKYSAFSRAEKTALILKVKQAALRPGAPAMTPGQAKEVQHEIRQMSM